MFPFAVIVYETRSGLFFLRIIQISVGINFTMIITHLRNNNFHDVVELRSLLCEGGFIYYNTDLK